MKKPLNSPPPTLFVNKGSVLKRGNREYVVLHLVDLNTVVARDTTSGEKILLRVDDHETPETKSKGSSDTHGPHQRDLLDVSEYEWSVAELWREKIDPLIRMERAPKSYHTQAASDLGVSVATLYRRLNEYKSSLQMTAFLPPKKSGGAGKARLREEVELIIQDRIDNFFLTDQKPTIAATAKEIRRLCSNAGLELPALNTIRLRLEWLDKRRATKARHGNMAAREFEPHQSAIPGADWPLAMVQIDHTKLPVIIVDDKHRLPIARAWITLAIDCFSRVCLGMHLSLDPPSSMSAGLCVAHAILQKERWLRRVGEQDIEWPFYGKMATLHMDNAKEFRGEMLKFACQEYDIDLHFRPVKKPHYGAYIERLMGTVTQHLKSVKGATFSGPDEKGEYDAEGNACMTFDELQRWLVLMFAAYHKDVHSGLGTSPSTKWREGIIGTKTQRGIGLPLVPPDEEKLHIDFMPFEMRGIYDYGVVIDEVHYFHDVLRPWMNLKDPDHPKQGRKYPFRRPPQDISQIYFFEPTLKRYFAIPYRDAGLPPVSVWEHRQARALAAERGIDPSNEREVYKLINRQREIEASAAQKTKSARTAEQKRVQHQKQRERQAEQLPKASQPTPTSAPDVLKGYNPADITAIDDDY